MVHLLAKRSRMTLARLMLMRTRANPLGERTNNRHTGPGNACGLDTQEMLALTEFQVLQGKGAYQLETKSKVRPGERKPLRGS
jgi:hypothetical protein